MKKMGIKNINSLVKEYCGHNYVTMSLKKFAGHAFAIDTSYFMYRYKAVAMKNIVERSIFSFSDGQWCDVDSHAVTELLLEQFGHMVVAFRAAKVRPVFVLDGIAPEEKSITQEARRARIKTAMVKQKEYKTDPEALEEYKKSCKNNIFLTPSDRIILLQFFLAIECEVIQSDGEAEKLCAQMCNNKEVLAAVSADTDLLAYGARVVVTDLNFSSSYHEPTVTLVVMNDVLKSLKMTQEQFLFLCILCGNDFNKNVPKFGPQRCYKLIQGMEGEFDIRKAYKTLVEKIPEFGQLDFETSYQVFMSEVGKTELFKVEHIGFEEFLNKHFSIEKAARFKAILQK